MYLTTVTFKNAPPERIETVLATLKDAVARANESRPASTPAQVYLVANARGDHMLITLFSQFDHVAAFFASDAGRGVAQHLQMLMAQGLAHLEGYEGRWQAYPPYL